MKDITMLKVLVVDDEPIIRNGLKNIIQWNDYGFEICGEAVDGEDGLIKAVELKPDLIIVDIKMPGMDGLNMIRNLRSENNNCKVIILSGYSDFTYAQKAIEYGVELYLLKPIDRIILVEKIKTIYDFIKKEMEDGKFFNKSISISREKIFENLVNGEIDTDLLERLNKQYGFGFPWDYYQVILIEPDSKAGIEEQSDHTVKVEIEKYISENNLGILFSIGANSAILSKNRVLEANNKYCEEINKIFKSATGSDVFIAVGKAVKDMENIFSSYAHAHKLIGKKFIYGSNRIISGKSGTQKSGKDRYHNTNQGENEKILSDLYMAIDVNSIGSINSLMEDVRNGFVISGSSEEMIKIGYIYIYVGVINKLLTHNEGLKGLINIEESIFYDILSKKNLQELHRFIKYKLVSLSDKLMKIRPDVTMDKILDYIYRNCGEDMKLGTIARIFNYNSAYLGKKFKNYTGQYFNTYLDTVRMKKAQELLKEGLKIYQIAEKVGYEDLRYFHRKFKKYTGITPAAYKAKYDDLKD